MPEVLVPSRFTHWLFAARVKLALSGILLKVLSDEDGYLMLCISAWSALLIPSSMYNAEETIRLHALSCV